MQNLEFFHFKFFAIFNEKNYFKFDSFHLCESKSCEAFNVEPHFSRIFEWYKGGYKGIKMSIYHM